MPCHCSHIAKPNQHTAHAHTQIAVRNGAHVIPFSLLWPASKDASQCRPCAIHSSASVCPILEADLCNRILALLTMSGAVSRALGFLTAVRDFWAVWVTTRWAGTCIGDYPSGINQGAVSWMDKLVNHGVEGECIYT